MENVKSDLGGDARENSSAVAAYYEQAMIRMLHEYDQRDRDFATHVTVNVGLFAATGFISQIVRADATISWIAASLMIFMLSIFGTKAAKALLESVRSFTHWQSVLNEVLAKLESELLPANVIGIYQRVLQLGGKPSDGADVVQTREKLALSLLYAWRVLAIAALLLLFMSLFAATDSKFATQIRTL